MARILFVLAVLCALSILAADPLYFELVKIPSVHNRLKRALYQGLRTHRRDEETVQLLEGSFNDGEYYLKLEVGNPSQTEFVQIDTSTSDLLVYSSDCNGCRFDAGSKGFNFSKSKSFKYIPCDDYALTGYKCSLECSNDVITNLGYNKKVSKTPNVCNFGLASSASEGNIGMVSVDVVKVKGVKPFVASFGLVQLLQGDQSDLPTTGSFGLGFSAHAFSLRTAFDSLIHDNRLYDSFSMCLLNSQPSLTIGQKPSAYPGFEWTDFEYPFYNVNVSSVSVGGVALSYLNLPSLNSQGMTLIDSGSAVLGFNSVLWQAFNQSVANIASTTDLVGYTNLLAGETILDGYCYYMTNYEVSQYPTVSIKLNNIARSFDISPHDYLAELGPGVFCSQIVKSPVNHGNILGTTFMQTANIVFDRKKHRIGFGDTDTCSGQGKRRYKL